ncbi:hypothetical protein C0J52_09614 [Blattella germanica]|nr:hypothetical protein C0J52_09614 [Blattella germanica]
MAGLADPDMFRIPVAALSTATRDKISTLLNPIKIIPTDDGLPRDWRGLAQLVGLPGEMVVLLSTKSDPTTNVMYQWKDGTLGLLTSFLGQLDRWDVVDDTSHLMLQDGIQFLDRKEKTPSSASAINADIDKQIITVADVYRLEQGLEPQRYDAFLLFAEEDQDFAMQIVEKMENDFGLKRLRKVVPVMYQRCELPPELNYYFWLDYSRSGKLFDFWLKLHNSVHSPSSVVLPNRCVKLTELPSIKAAGEDFNNTKVQHYIEVEKKVDSYVWKDDFADSRSLGSDVTSVQSSAVSFLFKYSYGEHCIGNTESTYLHYFSTKCFFIYSIDFLTGCSVSHSKRTDHSRTAEVVVEQVRDSFARRPRKSTRQVELSCDVLQRLKELKCDKHKDESNLFSQFFHDHSESIWSAPPSKKKVFEETMEIVPSTLVGNNTDEQGIIVNTDNIGQITDADIAGTQNPILDLISSLDEETAKNDMLIGISDQHLTLVMQKLSDSGLCHLCMLVCSMSTSEQSRLGSLVCRQLLLPKLQGKMGELRNRGVVKAIVEFTKNFPHLSCTEVLLPLLLSSEVTNDKESLLQVITEGLDRGHRENLLRNFLEHEPTMMEEWQIPLIQEMVSSACGERARQQLVLLMFSSADSMSRNIHFAKLLVSVIQHFGPGAPVDVLQKLTTLVSNNKSVLKRAAERALQTLEK